MEKTLSQKPQTATWVSFLYLSMLGASLITLSSFLKIPFYPVPFTMHTFAISILALTQSPKHAFGSVLFYLLFASIGLPVFGGKSNLLWMASTSGGYLVAFPIAAYISSKLNQKTSSYLSLFCGQMIIYLLGFLWLVPSFGLSVALMQGIIFFLPSDLLKNLIAIYAVSFMKKWRSK